MVYKCTKFHCKIFNGFQVIQLTRNCIENNQREINPTRIVRGSDYSPASELFARVRQTMTGNNPKLDLVNVDAHKKIGQILTICS